GKTRARMAAAARTPSEPKSINERRNRRGVDEGSTIGPKVTGTGVISGLGAAHGGGSLGGAASGAGARAPGEGNTGKAVESAATVEGEPASSPPRPSVLVPAAAMTSACGGALASSEPTSASGGVGDSLTSDFGSSRPSPISPRGGPDISPPDSASPAAS